MPFYQCKKCNQTWQYPVKKCPDCFLDLVRLKSEKSKVIGISKVNIPSIMHPVVPYFVLLLEDEHGNKWAHKSIKDYKIGDDFVVQKSTSKDAVSIWRIKYNIEHAIEKSIELLNLTDINQNSKILLLPTISTPKHPYLLESTSPEFLEAVLQYLFRLGVDTQNIKVASQSFNDFEIEKILKKSKLIDVCEKNNIEFLDFAKTEFVQKEKNGILVGLSKELFDKDLIINIPILKLNEKTGPKGATENLIKVVQKDSFLELQQSNKLDILLKVIQDFLPQTLTVADADRIKKSNQFIAYLGLVLAGFSSKNLDKVFLEICMKDVSPKYLNQIKTEDIEVVGRQIDEVKYNIEGK
jgi:hypothetical protein